MAFHSVMSIARGFTLIEISIALGVLFIFASALFPIYGNFFASSQINDAASGISSTMRLARERSIARLGNSSWGVYFEISPGDGAYILYKGDSYAARDAGYDVAVSLGSSMSIESTFLGNEVNFLKGLGKPNATGTVTVRHDVKGFSVISVNRLGIVE